MPGWSMEFLKAISAGDAAKKASEEALLQLTYPIMAQQKENALNREATRNNEELRYAQEMEQKKEDKRVQLQIAQLNATTSERIAAEDRELRVKELAQKAIEDRNKTNKSLTPTEARATIAQIGAPYKDLNIVQDKNIFANLKGWLGLTPKQKETYAGMDSPPPQYALFIPTYKGNHNASIEDYKRSVNLDLSQFADKLAIERSIPKVKSAAANELPKLSESDVPAAIDWYTNQVPEVAQMQGAYVPLLGGKAYSTNEGTILDSLSAVLQNAQRGGIDTQPPQQELNPRDPNYKELKMEQMRQQAYQLVEEAKRSGKYKE